MKKAALLFETYKSINENIEKNTVELCFNIIYKTNNENCGKANNSPNVSALGNIPPRNFFSPFISPKQS